MSIPFFPSVTFNKKIFKVNKTPIPSSYDIKPSDPNLISSLTSDIKSLIDTVALQQIQINLLKTTIENMTVFNQQTQINDLSNQLNVVKNVVKDLTDNDLL